MELQIKDRTYSIKYTMRALFLFEGITGQAFRISNLLDELVLFYSILAANSPDLDITLEDLTNWLDENPICLVQFREWLRKEFEKQ